MDARIQMNPNLLVRHLQKPAEEFTKQDIIRYCEENQVEFINFHYCGWDGRLKTLNFVVHSLEHLDSILSAGERVDGSSLFPFIEAGKSDLYVMPKFRTAFRNPFTDIPTVDILCSFYNRDGEPFESSPEHILHKAHQVFQKTTGLKMETMGELEYYIIANDEETYEVPDQKGYHESAPFNKFTDYRTEAMRLIAQAGGLIKYGHSEVGNFTKDGKIYEQNEIEFLPTNIEDAADQLVVAKWIMRQLAYQYGVTITFAPKITVGKAGSGLHVHCKFTKNGKSVMVKNGELTDYAKKAIAGFMMAGTSLPAFGNPNPLSFMRFPARVRDLEGYRGDGFPLQVHVFRHSGRAGRAPQHGRALGRLRFLLGLQQPPRPLPCSGRSPRNPAHRIPHHALRGLKPTRHLLDLQGPGCTAPDGRSGPGRIL